MAKNYGEDLCFEQNAVMIQKDKKEKKQKKRKKAR